MSTMKGRRLEVHHHLEPDLLLHSTSLEDRHRSLLEPLRYVLELACRLDHNDVFFAISSQSYLTPLGESLMR